MYILHEALHRTLEVSYMLDNDCSHMRNHRPTHLCLSMLAQLKFHEEYDEKFVMISSGAYTNRLNSIQ